MNTEGKKISFARIIYYDYSFGVFLALILISIVHLLIYPDDLIYLYMGIFSLVIGIPMVAWRAHFFKTLYDRGVEITGDIVYVAEYKRGNRLEYEYVYQGEKFRSGNALQRSSSRARTYQIGDEVVLIVDPLKPKNAVLKDFYFSEI